MYFDSNILDYQMPHLTVIFECFCFMLYPIQISIFFFYFVLASGGLNLIIQSPHNLCNLSGQMNNSTI